MALTERFSGFTVASALAHRATADAERPFIIFRNTVLTYGEVDGRAESLAAALHGLGIEAGDRIALVLPAWPEFVISMFAAAKLGAIIVPLNPRLTTPELHYMLRHSEAVVAVTVETFDGVDYLQVFEDLLVELPELQYLVTVGEEDLWYDDCIFQFEDLLSSGEGRDFPSHDCAPAEDLFAILYTSGTTGKPKGVGVTHENLLQTAAGTVEAVGLEPEDRVAGLTALFHIFGIGPGILGSLMTGASLVLQDEFDGGATLDLIERHAVTVQFGIPTLFVTELHEQRRSPRDVSSLRLGVAAGAPIGEGLVREVEHTLCPALLVAYSLTETSSTVAITTPGDSNEKRRFTVGRPLPGTTVRVVETDGGELPEESVGELAVRGPGVMKGYYRQPRETSASLHRDGFFLTGDLGIVDEEGFIHLVGRLKEVIIRSGFNVYPREVEDRLRGHPAVRDVAVVGVQDEVLGEAICACIVLVEGAIVTGQEIKSWCRVTLADYKVPDLVRFLDEFPLTGTGKIRRVELARMIRAERQTGR
ncbi:MAG TPA: class I adenylate-forming enzyme family protein [Longimicrobiales bacterium]|jgi:fatty-acyl-CoA synthase